MIDTLSRWLAAAPSDVKPTLRKVLEPIADRLSTQSLISAGLVIKGVGNTLAKTGGSAWYGMAQGKLITKGAATDMPALSGTVVNATFNVFAFFFNAAGTITSQMGTPGATLAAVVVPTPPVGSGMLGMIVINPTGTGNFVGGTTNLDDATVVPNAAYISCVGAIDPSVLL
jgi:hypothetical protein